MTRRLFGILMAVVVLAALAFSVIYSEWWWFAGAVGYVSLLTGLVFWQSLRRLRLPYRAGAEWGVGLDDQCLRIADGRTEGLYRYSTIARMDERGGLVIMKIVRGQRVAWPRELFGDDLLAQVRRRVDSR
ncbi:hypothetical protein [Gordonia effusa]|nr:hypothetical protein [Gordonia effusa]